MIPVSREELGVYLAQCERLQGDITLVRTDLREQISGWRLRQVVDFSEIHAFVYPDDDGDGMSFFADEGEPSGRVVEQYALERLFFDRDNRAVLPDPYAIELETFIHSVKDRAAEQSVPLVPQALEEASAMLEGEDARRILGMAAEIQEGRRALTPEEVATALAFFEKNAQSLLLVMAGTSLEPLRRLRALLSAEPFEELEDLTEVKLFGTEKSIQRVFDRLQKLRGKDREGANYLDAVALELVREANQKLARRRTKLLLVSRSKHLSEAYEEERQVPGTWDRVGHVLRHPRHYGPFFRPAGLSAQETLEHLEEQSRGLELFIASARERLATGGRRPLTSSESQLREALDGLKESWRRALALASSTIFPAPFERGDLGDDESKVLRLLRLIHNRDELLHEVEKRVAELVDSLHRDHEFLGWYLQSSSSEARNALGEKLAVEGWSNKAVFSSSIEAMPYTLQFYSAELREQLQNMQQDRWELDFQKLLQFFRRGVFEDNGFERLLAMAFTLGAFGRWKLAERYCETALAEAEALEIEQVHEGLFFLAVCLRRAENRSPERLRRAIELLDQAQELKRKIRWSEYEDPRYIKEKATQLQAWDRMIHEVGGDLWQVEGAEVPDLDEAERLLHRALELAEEDERLKVQVYNNLTYLHVSQEDRQRARESLDTLTGLLRRRERDPARWPAFMLDTVAWAEFTLQGEKMDSGKLNEWVRLLHKAARRREVSREDRERVEKHIAEMRASLRRRESESAAEGS